jgi:protein-disulfide isomerase
MSRPLVASLAAALLCVLAGSAQNAKKSALDKATMEAYVRHLFVMDSRITVQVSDPKPSAELPGFSEVMVHASAGNQSQDFQFLVSKDGSKILQGTIYDVGSNPFKRDLDRIKTEFSPSFGTPGATVVIVAFSDFQCPYCKDEASMIRQNLLSAYPKQVRFYYKEFPLESIHPWAKPAAMAGRCVFRQNAGSFWNYHDWVYAHQAEITPENLRQKVLDWAKDQKDIDAIQLGRCMDNKSTLAEVDRSIAQARELQVTSTPTLFVNGRRIAQTVDWPNLRAMIDYEIEYQKTAKNAGEDCGCELKLNVPGVPAQTPAPFTKK